MVRLGVGVDIFLEEFAGVAYCGEKSDAGNQAEEMGG